MPPTFPTEADVLARARELDSRALGEIHDRYYPELYRYALYRTSDPETAADIASETFLRLLDALHRRRGPQTTLRGWLFGVASHLVADHFRAAPALPLDESLLANGSATEQAEERIRRQQTQAAIRRLSEEQQQVLALRFGDGFSVDETAQALGKPVTAVKALQFRALEALRRALVEVSDD